MGTFRRAGTIMLPTDALNVLDAKYGIDDIQQTPLGTMYLKNGDWHELNDGRAEQCVAGFLPDDIELVAFVNSPFTVVDTFTGELGHAIKEIYLNNIVSVPSLSRNASVDVVAAVHPANFSEVSLWCALNNRPRP